KLSLRFLVARASGPSRLVKTLLQRSEVGDGQLEFDYLSIAHRIDCTHDVRHVRILEAAHDVHDRIGLAGVGEEFIAQPLALGGSFDESRDINELDDGG